MVDATHLSIVDDPELSEVGGNLWGVDVCPVVVELGFCEFWVTVGEDGDFDELLFLFWMRGRSGCG